MKEFNIKRTVFTRSTNSTKKMMNNVFVCLIVLVIFSVIKNGIIPITKGYGMSDLFKTLLVFIIPVVVGTICEYLFYTVKKEKDNFFDSFPYLSGLFLGLMIPINTPIWLIIIGSIIMTLVAKLLMGGLGKNIFNPALLGAFVILIINIILKTPIYNSYEASIYSLVDYNYSLFNSIIGNIPGTISALLCLFGFIYLYIKDSIKTPITISCLLTVIVISFPLLLIQGYSIGYSLIYLLSGYIFFGAIFIATDPVTSPITKNGQIISGIVLGILIIVIRQIFNIEGTIIALFMGNIINIFINKLLIYRLNKEEK